MISLTSLFIVVRMIAYLVVSTAQENGR